MYAFLKANFSKSSNALFLAFFLCLSLAGVSAGLAADELKIAYNTGVAPLKFEDQAGQPAGMFPDLWRLWAEKTGRQVRFVKADTFGASLQMLEDGAVDLHAGLFKTPEREAFLDYSEPFLTLDYYTFTHPSVYPIKTLERTSGLIVGVPEGGYTERYVRSIVPENRLAVYGSYEELFRAALEGEVKVFVAAKLSLFYYLRENFLLNIFGYDPQSPLFSQVYYTATKKGNASLIQIVNEGLAAIDNQTRKRLEDKWIVRKIDQSEANLAVSEGIDLSVDEQAFLRAHPVIRVHNEKEWPPFNYFEFGSPRGLSIDYMNLLAQKLGIRLDYITGPSWSEFLEMARRKELDVMLNIVKTEDRMKYLLYTEPYVKNPNVIVSSRENAYQSIEQLFGKTVAVPRGFFYEEVLAKSFPRITPVLVEDTLASLKAVSFGRADAALGEAAVMRTLIGKNMMSGLAISGEVNIGNPDLTGLRIAVRDDWPLLNSALMKAMATVTPQEMSRIRQKWLVTDGPTGPGRKLEGISYGRLIGFGIAVFLVLSLLGWLLIKFIRKEHIAVHFGSRWFRGLVLTGLSLFVVIVSLMGWFVLDRNKENVKSATGEYLGEILRTADERLDFWVAQRKSFLKLLGRDPKLGSLTDRLLMVGTDREGLLASNALHDMRAFFEDYRDIVNHLGFYIISRDHVSIGSKWDFDIGTPNLISLHRPDLLEQAFEGKVLYVPPTESGFSSGQLAYGAEGKKPAVQFFMAPVEKPDGRIIAVVALRVDPSADFSKLLSTSKSWMSAETYAFSEQGRLLSGSRFDDQLRQIGLLAEGRESAQNIEIRDPGVNLVQNRKPEVPRSQQPLTHMVSSTLKLKRDMERAGQDVGRSRIVIDTTGYRDYRGVPVFGAWLWNADLGLGLATEMDVAETLANHRRIQRTVLGILAATLLLSVGATILVLLIGERTSKALSKARDELELRVQERTAELSKLSQATEASPASVVITDATGTIEYVNPTFCEVSGYTSKEVLGHNPRVLKSGSLPESHYKKLWDTILSGKVWRGQFINKRKNGEDYWESASISPIMSDDGRITHFVAVKQDITERKAAEEALRASEEKSRLLLESVGEGIFGVDLKGRVAFINPAACRMLGYGHEDLLGEGVHEKIHHTRADGSPYAVEECPMYLSRVDGTDYHIEGEMLWRKDGTSFPVEYTSMPVKKNGEVVGAVVAFRDITERLRMAQEILAAKEKAEEATKAKGDFLANMSHEIRTPMNAVIGMTHLALKTELTPKQQDYLNKIQSSANSLLGIINDILDFSKIEAGKLDMESVEFNLDDVLDNLANLVTVKAGEKEELEVLIATAQDVPRHLVGDPLRLGQILINLANNAVKFTEKGEIVISTVVHDRQVDGVSLQFSVRDTGIGLTDEQMGRLFESFSQADTSTTRRYGGTGLGLSISKRLVEMMGGNIWVQSAYGKGATFHFTARFGIGKEKLKKRFEASHDLRGMKVLVVDDNRTSRSILCDILESFSFEVYLASTGEDGLEEIEKADAQKPFDLVLMDWKMPGMDGLEASRRIKTHPQLKKIPPVVMVTAYGREELMQRSERLGLEGFLIKPVNPSVLFDTIMEALGQKTVESSQRQPTVLENSSDDMRGARVLLAEDNEINQQVAFEILQGAGLEVTVVGNGLEAVGAVKNNPYDVVLMDIQMPVMDGHTAAREIRNLKSDHRNIPIIAMTAHAMAGDEEKSLQAGMNGHITKPIDPEQLFATLSRWIGPAQKSAATTAIVAEKGPGELPDSLEGFDLTAGLKRLGGNHKLYRKLLIDFGNQYSNTADAIRSALSAGDFEQAHSLVHDLKGLAGNLEAGELLSAALGMEKRVKTGHEILPDKGDLEAAFLKLQTSLQNALAAVRTLGPADVGSKPGTDQDKLTVDPFDLPESAAERIKAAADIGDVMQVADIASELKSTHIALAPICDRIIKLADDFDLDEIMKLVQ